MLEIVSVPAESTSGYSLEDLLGSLGLAPASVERFGELSQARDLLVGHFSTTGLGDLVSLTFDENFVVVEESPGKAKALSAVAGAGAIATGFAVFGPWAIIAVPAGVFLLAAAPEAGRGFGEWVGDWFRGHRRNR
ncbi:hypothetical protein [Terrabacter carboxydivorans]|uniref:Uncharacterized protein n=1 Tax=Terrabacter carboxydivorans TaxID=619730 RepID=A0ABP5YX33_9MICO